MAYFSCFLLVGCNTPITNIGKDLSLDSNPVFKKEIRSTDNANLIKKSFLSIEPSTFRTLANSEETSIYKTISTGKDDLKRKFIITVLSEKNKFKASDLDIKFNKKNIVSNVDSEEEVSDISFSIDNMVEGENDIEVLKTKANLSDLKVDIVGFIDPIDIPRAIHSKIADDTESRKAPYVKGRVGIKFREGMKVKFEDNSKKALKDETGISLTTLKKFLKDKKVKNIYRAVGDESFASEVDSDERKAEDLFGTDVANLNLFYYLEVDQKEDIWKLVDEVKKLPFVEEAFPEFISKPAYMPNDIDLNGTFNFLDDYGPRPIYPATTNRTEDKNKWLINTKVNNAWDITTGSPNVKIAVLDYGAQHSSLGSQMPSTHQDLNDSSRIETVRNVTYTGSGDNMEVGHGTSSAGIIGATTPTVKQYISSNVYPNLDYYSTSSSSGDQFNIGRSDNFSAYFSGFIKLPSGYSAGNYTIKIGHDDGAIFYFNGQQKFSYPSSTSYIVHQGTSNSLQTGIYYPFGLHYQELTGNADLKMTWIKPNGVEEIIPTSAFFY